MTTINDPVYGFIHIPRGLLRDLLAHPWFQRLDRIRQLGTSAFVYPGAQHTRKQHSLGTYHLTVKALQTLQQSGTFLFDSEIEAAEIATLLHDIGHGPFSHVLESVLIPGLSHEQVTLAMMERMNAELHGALTAAIAVFTGTHPKHFLHELVSSQLDMDRLDYLCRDSFYTGVREGSIGAGRIIGMLREHDGRLAIDAKGIYTVENYLMARRVMYWQVYLHKTTVAAEEVLRSALQRARELALAGEKLFCSPALHHFLYGSATAPSFFDDEQNLIQYARLDDSDILSALKVWAQGPDRILATLAAGFTDRRLFRVQVSDEPCTEETLGEARRRIGRQLSLSDAETAYFVRRRRVSHDLYSAHAEGISLILPDGTLRELSQASHIVRTDARATHDTKHYLLTWRDAQ